MIIFHVIQSSAPIKKGLIQVKYVKKEIALNVFPNLYYCKHKITKSVLQIGTDFSSEVAGTLGNSVDK